VETIYDNPRAWRARIAQVAIWIGASACAWLVFEAPANPNDGLADRIVGIAGAVLLLAALVVFEVFLRFYVLRIRRDGDTLLVTTLATLHHRTARLATVDVSLGPTIRDRSPDSVWAPSYDNLRRGLHAKGYPWPFVIDLTPTR
jgi:hypothetical protein